jgi:hypothetical protein
MINPLGCIDHFTFQLTIHPKEITTIDTSACDQMFSPSGKQLWTTSGSFYDTLKSVNACDSILNINLTIDKSIRVDIYDSACNVYILPSTIQVDSSGIYKDTLASVSGCDSINSYQITIYQPTFTSLTVQSCGPYQLPSDRMVETSGIYVDTMLGAQGCDSVIQIQLTQLKPKMTVNRFGDSLKAYGSASNYLWLDCTNNFQIIPDARDSFFIPSIAGNYAVRGYDGNCADTSECFNFMIAHIKSFDNIDIKVYPNPSDGLIKWDFPTESRWEVLLTDSRGRVIYKGETSKKQVRFNNLSPGMYFLTLSCQNLVSHIPVFFKD